jgi:hypothetical protein
MRIIKLAIILLSLMISLPSYSQTNLTWLAKLKDIGTNGYYHPGEVVIVVAPTMTVHRDGGKSTFGASAEIEYWRSLTMGTGLEIGGYDIVNRGIDHIAIMANYRLVCLPKSFLMNKFAIVAKSSAETYLSDGAKGMSVGIGLNYNLFKKDTRLEISYMHHFCTKQYRDGGTLRAGIQFVF